MSVLLRTDQRKTQRLRRQSTSQWGSARSGQYIAVDYCLYRRIYPPECLDIT